MHGHSVRESDLCFTKSFARLPKTLACPEPVKTSPLPSSPPLLLPSSSPRCATATSGAKIKIGIGARGNASIERGGGKLGHWAR